MPYFALSYDVVPDFIERRTEFREAHLRMVRDAYDCGQLVMAGALGQPPDGALLVFHGDSESMVESFARADPYVRGGLVTSWRVRSWTVVVGGNAQPPKRS
jgi:uncharacterized protein